MRFNRRYLGPAFGIVMSLALVGAVFAGSSTARWTDAPVGKNTPIFQDITFTTFKVWSCANKNSDLNAYFDWMHHWPLLPSTGTRQVAYPCKNTTTKYTFTWSASSTADYSVEYTRTNNSKVSTNWSAAY